MHDRVAAIEAEGIFQLVEPFAGHLVAAVGEPAIGLKKDRGAEELVAVPPIARAARRATGAENTLVKPVELFAFGRRLEALLAARRRRLGLQPRFDRSEEHTSELQSLIRN